MNGWQYFIRSNSHYVVRAELASQEAGKLKMLIMVFASRQADHRVTISLIIYIDRLTGYQDLSSIRKVSREMAYVEHDQVSNEPCAQLDLKLTSSLRSSCPSTTESFVTEVCLAVVLYQPLLRAVRANQASLKAALNKGLAHKMAP